MSKFLSPTSPLLWAKFLGLSAVSSETPTGNIVTTFGELTLAAAGGVAVTGTTIFAGDPSGHWQIVGGRITPSAAGAAADLNLGPYSLILDNALGQQVDITITANEASVRSLNEAWWAMGTAPIFPAGGATVRFRAGVNDCTTGERLADGVTYTSTVILTGETGAICNGTLTFEDSANVTVEQLELSSTGATNMICIGQCTGMTIQDNYIHGTAVDPFGDFSGAGSYPNGLGFATAAGTNPANFSGTIRRNRFVNLAGGVVVTSSITGGINVTDNELSFIYEDGIKFALDGAALTGGVDVSRNVMYAWMGSPSDADNPHIDGIQFLGGANTDIENVVCRQNVLIHIPALSRGSGVQGITSFTDGGGTITFVNSDFNGNTILLDSPHGLTLNAINGGTFVNNTIAVYDPTQAAGTQQVINLGSVSSAGNVDVRNNVCDGYSLLGAATYDTAGNVTMGQGGATIPYTTQFDGPTFVPASFEEAKTKFSVQSGTAGAIGSGYGVYGDVRDETSWSFDPSYETSSAIQSVFNAGSRGFWYKVNDASTLWEESTQTTQVTTSGDPIGYAQDQSGNGHHATQATSAARPTWQTDHADQDGTDDKLAISLASGDKTSDMTLFLPIRTTDSNFVTFGNSAAFVGLTKLGAGGSPHSTSGTPTYYVDGVEVVSATQDDLYNNVANGSWHILEIRSIDMTNADWEDPFIVGYVNDSFAMAGDWGEVVLCETPDAATLTAVREELAAKYGVTL